MLIFLYGPDDYRRQKRKRFYITEFQKKYSKLSVERFDMAAQSREEYVGTCARLEEFIRGQSLFAAHKMAVVENAFLNFEPEFNAILRRAAKYDSDIVILLSEQELPKGTEWNFLLNLPVIHERFERLSGAKFEAFISKEAKELNVELAPRAISFLADAYEGDTWSLVTELQKLSSLRKQRIDVQDLEDAGVEVAPEFFELLYGLQSGSVRSRLAALQKLFAAGEPPAKIFHVLAYQVPKNLPLFAEYDFKVKSGKLDYEEALLDLAIS